MKNIKKNEFISKIVDYKLVIKISEIFFVFVFMISICSFCYGYQHEGFEEYSEGNHVISFKCSGSCKIFLGKNYDAESLIIDGKIEGRGIFALFSQRGSHNNLLRSYQVSPMKPEDLFFSGTEEDFRLILRESSLLLTIGGEVEGNLKVGKKELTLLQNISKYWNNFWKMENFTSDCVNFRYGIVLSGVSIIKYGYIIFVVWVFILVLLKIIKNFKKEDIFRFLFYFGLGLFLFIGIRNTITYTVILKEGLSRYRENMNYFELDDYIPFINKIRDKLDLDKFENTDCKVFIITDRSHWLVSHHGGYFLKPCEWVYSSYDADYILYYNKKIKSEDLSKKILVEYNGNYFLDNKSK